MAEVTQIIAGLHMANEAFEPLNEKRRSNWVRLRTLIVLRWIAIAGQLTAILIAQRLFDLDLDVGLCLLVVGISIAANLVATFVYPENTRLTENAAVLTLIFDISQLCALLFLAGGLNNPFALLILAPVTISATALRTWPTVVVGLVAIILISFISVFHVPLQTTAGDIKQLPPDFVFGFWTSIVIGLVFLGAYARRVSSETHSMSEALLATQMALAREQKISDLSGVVAAAAHELGTPLATIKLTSSELMEDLPEDSAMFEDAQLIRNQADRCRDILQSMGRAGNLDAQLNYAPLSDLVREAAEPHMDRGIEVVIGPEDLDGRLADQPEVLRRAEILHGLRNLIQNAVDFAVSSVWIDLDWSDTDVTLRIIDDGKGFAQEVKGRIGDPYLRARPSESVQRREYAGMGLGLFIAKTLLERSGAELSFANGTSGGRMNEGSTRTGAIVQVRWPMDLIRPDKMASRRVHGVNTEVPS